MKVATEAGADLLGFVFVDGSPRKIDPERAISLIRGVRALSASTRCVGLFCDETIEKVVDIATACQLGVVQLHGHESGSYIQALSAALDPDLDIWKAIPLDMRVFDSWRHNTTIKAILIDAPHRPGELTGGTGRTLDWDALASLDRTGLPPIMLAGGLTPDNVAEAIRVVRPTGLWGVDVSSGVESARGVKDPQKIQAFCDAVRHG